MQMNHEAGKMTMLALGSAISESLTIAQAVEALKTNAFARTTRELLAKYAGIPAEDKKALQAFYTHALMKTGTVDINPDSVRRKVNGWLDEKTRAMSKASAVELCFLLELSLEDAEDFLCRACGEPFHWRDPQDIVYLFSLRSGFSYAKAQQLSKELQAEGLMCVSTSKESYTHLIHEQFEQVENVQDLRDLLREAQPHLGQMHNTAYAMFTNYLNLLTAPNPQQMIKEKDRKFTAQEVTETYLFSKMIPRIPKVKQNKKSDVVMTALQKNIHQSWPDTTTLSQIIHRKADVSRKVLILLFLATDGDTQDQDLALSADDIFEEYDTEMTREERFEDMYSRLNNLLADCGFAPLDPRVPFDWMMLYCMCVDDVLILDERIIQFLEKVFEDMPVEP